MNLAENELLLSILAHVDGSIEPADIPDGPALQADFQVRRSFEETGSLPIRPPTGRGLAAERQRRTRALASLEHGGLLFRDGAKIGLTPSGDQRGRELANIPTLADAVPLLVYLNTLSPAVRWSNGMVSETSLVGLPPWVPGVIGEARLSDAQAEALSWCLAPLLAGRLIHWRPLAMSGPDGIYLFGATAQGLKAAACLPDGTADKWPKILCKFKTPPLPESYAAGWLAAYLGRATATPAKPNLIMHLDPVDAPPQMTAKEPL